MRKFLLAAVAAAAIASPAAARDGSGYVGADLGVMLTEDTKLDFDNDTTFINNAVAVDYGLGFDIGLVGGYSLTYGSLAGVMIALLFFFFVGLGVVIGAELNAALAESGAKALKGEVYSGPYTDQLEVEEPQPGEDVEQLLQAGGPQL